MKHFLPFLALALIFAACQSPAPLIETSYESQTIDVQLDNLTNQMVKSLSQERKSKIAIMEFPDLHGNVSELGKFIPEELTTRLFITRRFEVVERQLLNKVLEEQNLGTTGLVDATSAAQIGKMLGVDAIVSGTITDMGNTIRINARMIATETASIFAVSSVSIDKEEHIAVMMTRMAGSPAQTIPAAEPRKSEPIAISPASIPAEIAPERVALAKTEVDNFLYEFISGRLTADKKLILEVLVTNKSHKDEQISINRNDTRLYDNMGQEYTRPVLSIGPKQSGGSWSSLNHLFVSNVPTLLRLEFIDVDPRITSIALLNIKAGRNDAQLRNISVEK